jgi:hypothetical protein
MRYTYLVIDTGEYAYVERVSPNDNILKYHGGVLSVSAYAVKNEAEKQAQFLNKIVYRDKEVQA